MGLAPAYALITLGYVQGAVYNAVMAIEGGYEPYHSSLARQPDASVDAAVAAAAYRVLAYHLTATQETNAGLAGKYADALAAIPNGAAKDAGILLGQAAADEMIALRAGDGYVEPGNAYPYVLPPPGPGVFELTPPAAAALTPWVANMRWLKRWSSSTGIESTPNASRLWARLVETRSRFSARSRPGASTSGASFVTTRQSSCRASARPTRVSLAP